MNKFIVAAIVIMSIVLVGAVIVKTNAKAGPVMPGETPKSWDSWENKNEEIDKTSQPKPEEPKVEVKLPAPNTYAEALAYAKAKNKNIFLFAKTDYCQACKLMDQKTLSDAVVLKALKAEGICMIYYLNPDVEPAVAQQYKIKVVPTYWVIDANEAKLKSGVGYKTSAAFLAWLK
jgi:thiol:disulfide interchange protein